MGAVIERVFKVGERGSTPGCEVMAGVTTFLTMAYIVAVNPTMLQAAGIPFNAALTATCFGAALMTAAMGLIANRPIALASGMGINAVVSYTLCGSMGVDWRVAMGVILVEGVVVLLLVLCGLREAVMRAIPVALRQAIGIGIGLFIAFIGLKGGGILAADSSTLVTMGSLAQPAAIVSVVSIVLAVVLTVRGTKGGLLVSIVVATVVGIPLGVTPLPTEFNFVPDFSAFAAPFQQLPDGGGVAIVQVFVQPMLLMFVFSLLMSDFFDTMGIMLAIGKQGGFANGDGNVANAREILLVDSAAAAIGGFMGASSITSFTESASGVAAGGRTGLSNLVVALAFFACAFLAPVIGMVSSAATCGSLVIVGYLMMRDVVNIDWESFEAAIPAFITIIGIPFTYSIANGIGLGFISYVVVMVAQGRAREIHPLMWAVSIVFLITFAAFS